MGSFIRGDKRRWVNGKDSGHAVREGDAGIMRRVFRVGGKMLVDVKEKRTLIMMLVVYMNTVYVQTYVCVSGSDAEQPAICRQINPGYA